MANGNGQKKWWWIPAAITVCVIAASMIGKFYLIDNAVADAKTSDTSHTECIEALKSADQSIRLEFQAADSAIREQAGRTDEQLKAINDKLNEQKKAIEKQDDKLDIILQRLPKQP